MRCLFPRERSALAHSERKGKPAGLGAPVGTWQREMPHPFERRLQHLEIVLPRCDEVVEFLQLRQAHGGLYFGHLQIESNVAVSVAAVVGSAIGQLKVASLGTQVPF